MIADFFKRQTILGSILTFLLRSPLWGNAIIGGSDFESNFFSLEIGKYF